MKPKLLYAIPLVGSIEWLKDNGALTRYLKEFNFLKSKFDITLISKDKTKFNIDKDLQHESLINAPTSIRNFLFLFFPILKPRIFKEADVYYADHVSGAFPLVLGKFLFRKKLIVRFNWDWSYFVKHEYNYITYLFVRFLENISIKYADIVIATTPHLENIVLEKLKFKNKVVVIPNWVDTDLFKPNKSKKKKNSIVSIGRLVPQKDYLLLLKSLNHLKNKYSLTIVGTGPQKNTLLDYAKKNNIKVNIIEKIENSEIPKYLNLHELYVSTSRYEGHPKAIIEAMSCAIPVIATNVVGNKDAIINKKTGIITQRDPKEISIHISNLNKSKSMKNKLANNARDYVTKNCGFDIVTKRISEELLSLIKK